MQFIFKGYVLPSAETRFNADFCIFLFGPSGVRALPLAVAAEQSVYYIRYYFSFLFFFLSVPHTFLPEWVGLGL
jgi:hypothetical protein